MSDLTTGLDYLASEALSAIATRPEMASWVESKAVELDGRDKLDVLRWIVLRLDAQNRALVAERIGVTAADLAAVARVLQRV